MDQKEIDEKATAKKQLHDNKTTGKKFSQMNAGEKVKFIGKAFVFLISGGMMYPNIFSD
jgi:hypothetical protein